MNVISPKSKFVMKIFRPITISALFSDDQGMPTLDSFWYMTSHLRPKQKLLILSRLNDFMTCGVCFNIQSEESISQL